MLRQLVNFFTKIIPFMEPRFFFATIIIFFFVKDAKQNKRNHHLQKAREAKKLKLLNPLQIKRYLKANTRLMQTFE